MKLSALRLAFFAAFALSLAVAMIFIYGQAGRRIVAPVATAGKTERQPAANIGITAPPLEPESQVKPPFEIPSSPLGGIPARPSEYHDLPPSEELAKILKSQTPEALENERRKREPESRPAIRDK